MATTTATASTDNMQNLPFDFAELFQGQEEEKTNQQGQESKCDMTMVKIPSTDGVMLNVRVYRPPTTATTTSGATAALVFYHGGGAHSGAGYELLATELARTYNIIVYTPDIRGHGQSGGRRGDTPSPDQVWIDVDTVLDYVIQDLDNKYHDENNNKNDDTRSQIPVFLGGHSSGAGLVINYATHYERKKKLVKSSSKTTNVTDNGGITDETMITAGTDKYPQQNRLKGIVLVSPRLGNLAQVDRPLQPGQVPFATANIFQIVLNGIFGWYGNSYAVKFNYPEEVLEQDPGLVNVNSVNMSNAISPVDPIHQFERFVVPTKLWIGSNDELFIADKVASYAQPNSSNNSNDNNSNNEDDNERNTVQQLENEILDGETHLGILVRIGPSLGRWIQNQLSI